MLIHSSMISFVSRDNGLLSMMNVMFNLNQQSGSKITDFRVGQFLSVYRTFFTKTMPYEALSVALRVSLFQALRESNQVGQMPNLVAGPLAGMVSQIATLPLFLTSLRNLVQDGYAI